MQEYSFTRETLYPNFFIWKKVSHAGLKSLDRVSIFTNRAHPCDKECFRFWSFLIQFFLLFLCFSSLSDDAWTKISYIYYTLSRR